jgi:hypothetical protein
MFTASVYWIRDIFLDNKTLGEDGAVRQTEETEREECYVMLRYTAEKFSSSDGTSNLWKENEGIGKKKSVKRETRTLS